MTDFARLREKLRKLRQRERAPGDKRQIRGAPERLLQAIATEIDETILPRCLMFRAPDGVELRLAVANRRLQALLAPAPAVEGASALAGVALKDAEDPNVATLRGVLLKALASSEVFTLDAARPSGATFPSDVGVPSVQLMRAWAIPVSGAGGDTPRDALTAYVAALGKRARGWLVIEGEDIVGQGGAPDVVAGIGEQAAIFLDGYYSRSEAIFRGELPPRALILAAGGGGLVFLDNGGAMAFVAVSTRDLGAAAREWLATVA